VAAKVTTNSEKTGYQSEDKVCGPLLAPSEIPYPQVSEKPVTRPSAEDTNRQNGLDERNCPVAGNPGLGRDSSSPMHRADGREVASDPALEMRFVASKLQRGPL
jgi:hypothetical protein